MKTATYFVLTLTVFI